MINEGILNNFYNRGGFNQPSRIGYMMKMIRELKPLTEEEWRIWYLKNVHNELYLNKLSQEMASTIPDSYNIGFETCKEYIYDVMFRRTFNGYNKEKQALKLLRDAISPTIEEAPEDWDTNYFIDFFLYDKNHCLIGIQLKPDTFYYGHYQNKVDINSKMQAFRKDKNASTFILKYETTSNANTIKFVNPEIVDEIKSML